MSQAELSRFERGATPRAPFIVVARVCGAVGLELSTKAYAGGVAIRDLPQLSILADFSELLHPSLQWDLEVPMPIVGDQRAWDGTVGGLGWRFGVEAESGPTDAQALVRRIQLKVRDGAVDGVLLLLRDTRTTRAFLEAAGSGLRSLFTFDTRAILAALRVGTRPPGSGIVVVPRSPKSERSNPPQG